LVVHACVPSEQTWQGPGTGGQSLLPPQAGAQVGGAIPIWQVPLASQKPSPQVSEQSWQGLPQARSAQGLTCEGQLGEL
jgi:hypothetical protein